MGALCVSSIALRPCNHLERAKHHWNHLERRRHWNSPQGYWNVRSTIGTREAHNLSAEREVDADNR